MLRRRRTRRAGLAAGAALVAGLVGSTAAPAGADLDPGRDGTQIMVCTGTHTVATVNPTLKNGYPLFTAFAIRRAQDDRVYSLLDLNSENPINDNTVCTVDAGIRTENPVLDAERPGKYIFDNQSNGHATLTLARVGGRLVGSATCAPDAPEDHPDFSYPNAYPANGRLVWRFDQLDDRDRQIRSLMYVRLGLIDAGDEENDPIVGLKGIVFKGVGVGGDVETALSYFPTNHRRNATALNCGTLAESAGGEVGSEFGEIFQLYSFATEDENFDPIPLTVTLP